MVLGNNIVLRVKWRDSGEWELRRSGRVEADQHGGIIIYDAQGNITEELGLDRIEEWAITAPLFLRANDPPTHI